jgi:hypothetical protein
MMFKRDPFHSHTAQYVLEYTGGYRDHRSDPSIPTGQGNKDPYIQSNISSSS